MPLNFLIFLLKYGPIPNGGFLNLTTDNVLNYSLGAKSPHEDQPVTTSQRIDISQIANYGGLFLDPLLKAHGTNSSLFFFTYKEHVLKLLNLLD